MSTDLADASIKMFGSLALILGLIICLFYLLKRLRFGPGSHRHFPKMQLLGTLQLAPKRAVALLEICDQWFVVGIGTENVTLISKMKRPAEINHSGVTTDTGCKNFLSLLQKKQVGTNLGAGEKEQ